VATSFRLTAVGGKGAITSVKTRNSCPKEEVANKKFKKHFSGLPFYVFFDRLLFLSWGRMARINEEALDLEAMGTDGIIHPFEITTAYPPDYRIRERYKNGKQPEIP
jgi:hypothetical protein